MRMLSLRGLSRTQQKSRIKQSLCRRRASLSERENWQFAAAQSGFIISVAAEASSVHCDRRILTAPPSAAWNYWIFPVGREAAIASAHSTAVAAAMRRLSAAAHNQTPFAAFASGTMETR